jgi:hypothetical protein
MNIDKPPTADEALWARRHQVLYMARVSFSYHRKRQRFFDLLGKATQAMTVLLGASLLGETVKAYQPLVASAISGLGLLALVFGYGDRKQTHKELAESYASLQATVEEAGQHDFTAIQLDTWAAALSRLNAKEPPTLYALTTLCEYEQSVAEGHPDHVKRPPWNRRLLASWLSFDPV